MASQPDPMILGPAAQPGPRSVGLVGQSDATPLLTLFGSVLGLT
jgi:hypothetical protein